MVFRWVDSGWLGMDGLLVVFWASCREKVQGVLAFSPVI